MQSEIDDTRTAVAAISRIFAKGLMTPDDFQAFTAQVLTNLRLIELQQAEFRPAPGDVVVIPVMPLAQITAAAKREHRARFRVIEGEKA